MIHLERPIDLYMSDKLEFHLLCLEAGWTSRTEHKCPSCVREVVMMKARVPDCMHLVEGGRWVLGASDTGSVTYLDLDVFPITEIVLIQDQHSSSNMII